MDGDLYLIKSVKSKPILWDKNYDTRDNEARSLAWKEIAQQIGADNEWLRSRWYNLRERFVKELKLAYKTEKKSQYKYFKDMLFLAEFVTFRTGLDPNFSKYIQNLQQKTKQSQGKNRNDENSNEEYEFIITTGDIEDGDDDDDDGSHIFIELEEEKPVESVVGVNTVDTVKRTDSTTETLEYLDEEICDSTEPDSAHTFEEPYENSSSENEDFAEQPKAKKFKLNKNNEGATISMTTNQKEVKPANAKSNSKPSAETVDRCEDTIFGELVAAMLKRMDDSKKKNIKKEIMNLLLS